MKNFVLEVTDTFGGEANYTWIKRYKVCAPNILCAVKALARSEGKGWRVAYSDGESARYDLRGACVCMFVEYYDDAYHDQYDLIEI